MPPRISAASLRFLRSQSSSRSFCCSQCVAHRSAARINIRNRINTLRDIRTGRLASTSAIPQTNEDYTTVSSMVTPVTSINRPLDIKPANRALHEALEKVKTDAANHVNLSRLELALRSLEGTESVTRIGVLSMHYDVARVKRLVRLLLADPLGQEEAWEKELVGGVDQRLLIKYGEDGNAPQSNPQLKTLAIPSRTLQKHNIEIFIGSIDIHSSIYPSYFKTWQELEQAILVPTYASEVNHLGGTRRYTDLTYPVHRTLLVGRDIGDLVKWGKFVGHPHGSSLLSAMINTATETRSEALDPEQWATDTNESGHITLLNVDTGEHALASIRQSINNALTWERGWFKAGIPALSNHILEGTFPEHKSFGAPRLVYIQSILENAEESISMAEGEIEDAERESTIPTIVREEMLSATASWSEKAHEELRIQLDTAFASKNWARLKWWKLFWRSDDVTMLLTEIMERRWLPEAEKGAIYLAGRMEGAGLVVPDVEGKLLNPAAEAHATAPVEPNKPIPASYPTTIPTTRNAFAGRTIPSLQALSQTLVLQTGTGAAVTTALTAMAYIGFANATLFEAGAVFAFGVVISLKRLQNKWETAREYWQKEVKEQGRLALKETEEGIRKVVEEGGQPAVDEVAVEELRRAKEAVEDALEKSAGYLDWK